MTKLTRMFCSIGWPAAACCWSTAATAKASAAARLSRITTTVRQVMRPHLTTARPRQAPFRPGEARVQQNGGMAKRSVSFAAAVALAAGTLAACGNAKSGLNTAGNSSGVTAHSVVVGGIASLSGPLPADFAPVFDGVQAYLNVVNSQGGVNGRTIDFRYKLDDASSPSQNTDQARALVDEDHVF